MIDPRVLLCSGPSCSWLVVRKVPDCPPYSRHPFQPRNHCHLGPLFFKPLFYYFSLRDARRESARVELTGVYSWTKMGWEGSQLGRGVGDVEVAGQQRRKESFVRPTGEGGEDWISGPSRALRPSVFKTDVLHPSQSWGQRWELKMQSRSQGKILTVSFFKLIFQISYESQLRHSGHRKQGKRPQPAASEDPGHFLNNIQMVPQKLLTS